MISSYFAHNFEEFDIKANAANLSKKTVEIIFQPFFVCRIPRALSESTQIAFLQQC